MHIVEKSRNVGGISVKSQTFSVFLVIFIANKEENLNKKGGKDTYLNGTKRSIEEIMSDSECLV